jgi:hypothetical protein
VRLVGVDDSRVVGELRRQCEPGVSRRQQDVAKDAVAVELEAALGHRDTCDPRAVEALVPAAALPQLVDVPKERRYGRPIAVADAEDQRGQIASPDGLARRETWKRRGPAMAVALGAHRPLPDRRRSLPPGSCRVGVVAEHGDLRRLEPAVAQRGVRDEPAEPGADDRSARCHEVI